MVAYIDSHVHFWKLDRGDYHWLRPENKILYRDYVPSDLLSAEETAGVKGFIAVQAAPTVAETEYLLELAAEHERIIGVVGWLDPFSDSFADEYGLLRNNPQFVGIRLDRSVFERCQEGVPGNLIENLRLLEEDGFPVDLLITPEYMPAVLQCLKHLPNLKAVINHLGSPPIRDGALQPWNDYMHKLSKYPNVYCKWSGMITPAEGMNPDKLEPYIRITAVLFGPDRILFGGDWPVALLAGSYTEVVDLFEQLLPNYWNEAELHQVRFSNALKFYFGEEGERP